MTQKPYFHIFTSSLKLPADGASYYVKRFSKPSPLYFVKIIVKLLSFWWNFENGKMQKFGFGIRDL